jgi:hypothetical protein
MELGKTVKTKTDPQSGVKSILGYRISGCNPADKKQNPFT